MGSHMGYQEPTVITHSLLSRRGGRRVKVRERTENISVAFEDGGKGCKPRHGAFSAKTFWEKTRQCCFLELSGGTYSYQCLGVGHVRPT